MFWLVFAPIIIGAGLRFTLRNFKYAWSVTAVFIAAMLVWTALYFFGSSSVYEMSAFYILSSIIAVFSSVVCGVLCNLIKRKKQKNSIK